MPADVCKADACVQAEYLGGRCYAVDYRLPPDHPFPAALDDCVNAYRALLDRYSPRRIIVGGQSAGGNLAAAAMLRASDIGLSPPAGFILLTPELDLTESGDSFETERSLDLVLSGSLMAANLVYAAGTHSQPLFCHPCLATSKKDSRRRSFRRGRATSFFPTRYVCSGRSEGLACR